MSCARPLRALFLGFGNVGRAVAEVLEGRAAYPGLSGFEAEVVGIVTANHGAVANAAGLDLREVLAEWAGHGSLARHSDGTVLTALEAVRVLDYDVMVE
ncbi:MAG TPA: homoserine dehydrogenase, partial [Vicinamibacteria bacterium]|nr:homoserine dehydrogenase [Vicinamibacteria bacterium]